MAQEDRLDSLAVEEFILVNYIEGIEEVASTSVERLVL